MFHLPWPSPDPRPSPAFAWSGSEEVITDASRIHTLLAKLSESSPSVTMLEAAETHCIRSTLHPVGDPRSGLPISPTTLEADATLDQPFNVIASLGGVELMFSSHLRRQTTGKLCLACPTEILFMDLRHEYRIAGRPQDRVILTLTGGRQSLPVPLYDLSEGGICLRLTDRDYNFALEFAKPSNGLLTCEQSIIPVGSLRQCHLSPRGKSLRAGYHFDALTPAAHRQLRVLLLKRQAMTVPPRL